MQRKKLWVVGEVQPIIEFNIFGSTAQKPIDENDVKNKLYRLEKVPIFFNYDDALMYARSLRYVAPAKIMSPNFPRKRQFAPLIEIEVELIFINMISSLPINTVSIQYNTYDNFMSNFSDYSHNSDISIKWIPTNILYPSLIDFRSLTYPDSGFETVYFIPDEPQYNQNLCILV